jgi:hypothetical protein
MKQYRLILNHKSVSILDIVQMRWCRCFVISIGATLAFTVGCCAGQDVRDDSNPDAVPGIGTYNVRQEIQGLVKRLFSRVNERTPQH